jgi:hypothetical protein
MTAGAKAWRLRDSLWGQVALALAGFAVAVVLGYSVLNTILYRRAIPAEIDLTFGLATTGSSSMSLWDVMLPIRHEACGGAIFGLAGTTAAALETRGLAALRDAHQGRGYTDGAHRYRSYYAYQPWQPTPLPPAWTSEGMWLGLSCMKLGYGFGRSIVEAARAPGSFYTTGTSRMLLVVPRLKLVVYTYTS